MSGNANLLRLSGTGLACVRGDREVFSGVDFTVSAGEVMALTGPNGAGKTTLLRVIAGLLLPSGGKLTLEGGDGESPVGEEAHYVGHQEALQPALTVAENLRFWASFLGGSAGATARTAAGLEAVELSALADLPASYLSAGQRRRLVLARLVAAWRPLWLLDEPMAALDTASQANLGVMMQAHLARGGMIIASTHVALPVAVSSELRLGAR